MEIILITYFGINLFMTGYYINENLRWETKKDTIKFAIVFLLFGTIFVVFTPLFHFIFRIFEWFKYEIIFWYKFKCTYFWDKIILDPNYSGEYKTRKEKLERLKKIYFNKQEKRHVEMIYNRYK